MKKIVLLCLFPVLFIQCKQDKLLDKVVRFENNRIETLVEKYKGLETITVTDSSCVRSIGGKHDFYSEGDYWWPDPENPDGAYIRKDGLSNPNNFLHHRLAMVRMSRIVGALTSAYLINGDASLAKDAMRHLKAWFVIDSTKMAPHMLYAQAIQGRYTGRGIGLIDGLHLIEAARSTYLLQNSPDVSASDIDEIKKWFGEFVTWMSTHEYGKMEMIHANNHGTCWSMQAAAFAQLAEKDTIVDFCYDRFSKVLLPMQMAEDGSFPLELERTKPYGYSLFNLDAMSLLAQILYTAGYNEIWQYKTPEGKSLKKGIEYMYPYIKDKSKWALKPDVLYWNNWPVSQPSLVFTGIAYNKEEYIDLWLALEHDPEIVEVQRNLVMRYPLLWFDFKN